MELPWGEGLVCPPLPALWEVPGMTRRGKPPRDDMRPEWREYWLNPSSPHPDTGRAQRRSPSKSRPFPQGQGYCHHYGMVNEHYHATMSELEGCEQ